MCHFSRSDTQVNAWSHPDEWLSDKNLQSTGRPPEGPGATVAVKISCNILYWALGWDLGTGISSRLLGDMEHRLTAAVPTLS